MNNKPNNKKSVNNASTKQNHDAIQKSNQQKDLQMNRRAAEKKRKKIITIFISIALVIALIVGLIVFIKRGNKATSTSSTTYKIDKITEGNVTSTISGSSTLSPIVKETLTALDLLEELETDESDESEEGEEENVNMTSIDIDSSWTGGSSSGMTMPTISTIKNGTIDNVEVIAGQKVTKGDVIATISYENNDGEETKRNLIAPYDSVVLEFNIKTGASISDDTEVAMFMGTEGYSMKISVDESNISLVEIGQKVEISIDVSDEEMPEGQITNISYNGSSSGSTTAYTVEITFDYVEGTYPGMSVSAKVVIEDSGNGLLVPVSAVNTSGNTKYIYIAPKGSNEGDSFDEDEIDVSKLTKVSVKTGMSDGSYIIVESDYLDEGDLIVVVTRTSTATGSSSTGSNSGNMFGNGGLPSGNFPSGSFDFGNFDPSQFGGFGGFSGFGG